MTMNLLKLNDTTWKLNKIVDDDVFDTEIGDSKQLDFKPQIKIKRWDNECNFSVRLKEDDTEFPVVSEADGKIKYKKKEYEARMYEVDDGFEFEVEFDKKPKTNKVEFTINTKGLNFFYQPELTQEEIDEGASRADNVIGSYAVYHNTKANHKVGETNYKSGKAFHIYRPKIIDKNGDWTWGELNINENTGILTVTTPQDFLDNAVYPVIIDPTFGYTTLGSSAHSLAQEGSGSYNGSNSYGHSYSLSEDATLTQISVGLACQNGPDTGTVFVAIYDEDSAGSGSHDLLYSVEDTNFTAVDNSDTKAFSDFSISGSLLSANSDFILMALGDGDTWHNGSFQALIEWFDSSAGTTNTYIETTAGAGSYTTRKNEDPWSNTAWANSWIDSIYVTYTTGGGGADIAKYNNIAIADIANIHGVAKASISKINGLTI